MSKIARITAVPHLDSQSGFTIKVKVVLESGARGWGAVPKGASALKIEHRRRQTLEEQAIEQFGFQSTANPEAALVERWVQNLNRDLVPKLLGLDAAHQAQIDEILSDYDTDQYWKLYGINAVLAVSIAVARASADEKGIELFEHLALLTGQWPVSTLPVPMTTVLEGGYRVANDLDVQAVMIVPVGALSVNEAHCMTDGVFFKLKDIMGRQKPPLNTSVGEQGGFVPKFGSWQDRGGEGWRKITVRALDLVGEAITASGFKLGTDFCMALDCAMSVDKFDAGSSRYTMEKYAKNKQDSTIGDADPVVATEDLIEFYETISKSHAVWSIEDGLHRADLVGWEEMTRRIGREVRLVGDDLFAENEGQSPRSLLRKFSDAGIANSILVMPNRVGTVTATLGLVAFARYLGFTPVMAVRARETEDDAIVDMAVASGVVQLRCGGLQCSERNSKFERLKRIETLVGPSVKYSSSSLRIN